MLLQNCSEETAEVQELIRGSGEVMDHPMLRQIVQWAPNPKVANAHIVSLGWPNDLARRVRMAVRARDKTKLDVWRALWRTSVRPADALCDFSYFSPRLGSLFPTVRHKQSVAFKFGEAARSCKDWPFFLLEFAYELEMSTQWTTTVDWGPGDIRSFKLVTNPDDPKLFCSTPNCKRLNFRPEAKLGDHRQFYILDNGVEGPGFCFEWPERHLQVHTRIVQVGDPSRIPRFYKAVEITQSSANVTELERIRVLDPLDVGPHAGGTEKKFNPIHLGSLVYEHFVPLSNGFEQVLTVRYVFGPDLKLLPAWENHRQTSLRENGRRTAEFLSKIRYHLKQQVY